MMKISKKEILSKRTSKGAWTKDTLASWGVPWPPPKGWIGRLINGRPIKPIQRNEKSARAKEIARFYRSYEWARLRYDMLKAAGGVCMLCGSSRNDGAAIQVDHIKPLRSNWELRLDPANLQVLCGKCNRGKGNRDETDWR